MVVSHPTISMDCTFRESEIANLNPEIAKRRLISMHLTHLLDHMDFNYMCDACRLCSYSTHSHRPDGSSLNMPYIDPAPVKIDYAKYFSLESKNRQRSQLKELRPYFEMPGMISVSMQSRSSCVVTLMV